MTAPSLHRSLIVLLFLAATIAAGGLRPEPSLAAAGWTWPVSGEVITPYRNGADPYAGGQHRGVDLAAPAGTPVVAATAGTVRFAGVAGSSGLTVSVRTADGRFDTSYLHLSAVDVREGDRVRAAQRIGAVGTSGDRSATAPHLHFGVREAGSRHAYRDPLSFLPPPGAPVRERPREPVPVGAPVRVRPAPSPVRAPGRSRRRAPARRRIPARPGLRVPAGGRVRIPGRAPFPGGSRAPVPGGSRAPIPGLGPAPQPVPAAAARRAPLHAPDPGRIPARGPAPAGRPADLRDPSTAGRSAPAADSRAVPDPAGGPDLGWALACAGLLLAAACLGRPGDRRKHDPGARRPRGAWRAACPRNARPPAARPALGRRLSREARPTTESFRTSYRAPSPGTATARQ